VTRPLILGEAPSRTGDKFHAFPMSGLISQRFCEWTGIEPLATGTKYGRYYWALKEHFDLVWPGGTGWDTVAAFEAMTALRSELDGRVLVLLGTRLTATFQLRDHPRHEFKTYGWLETDEDGEEHSRSVTITWIYHPSSRTRQYNDPEEQALAGETLRKALEIES
jgi:hypothetical protein